MIDILNFTLIKAVLRIAFVLCVKFEGLMYKDTKYRIGITVVIGG